MHLIRRIPVPAFLVLSVYLTSAASVQSQGEPATPEPKRAKAPHNRPMAKATKWMLPAVQESLQGRHRKYLAFERNAIRR